MELKRLAYDDVWVKKKSILPLKTEEEKDSESNKERILIDQNFKRFVKREKQQEEKQNNKIRSWFTHICF